MSSQSLLQLLLFCGALLVPLAFTSLFTVRQYEKYAEEARTEFTYMIFVGLCFVLGCLLYMISAIGIYIGAETIGNFASIIASGIVFFGVLIMSSIALRMKQKTGRIHLP